MDGRSNVILEEENCTINPPRSNILVTQKRPYLGTMIIEDSDMYVMVIWFVHRAPESEGRRRIPSWCCWDSGSVGDDDECNCDRAAQPRFM